MILGDYVQGLLNLQTIILQQGERGHEVTTKAAGDAAA